MAALAALSLTPTLALAHEAWLLAPREMLDTLDRPVSEVWQRITWLSIAIGVGTILVLVVLEYADRRLQPLEQQIDRQNAEKMRHWALLVLRVSLGLMMIAAAIGLNPRHGTAYFSEPVLFVPDLEFSAATSYVHLLAGLELVIGVALVAGIYVNLAAIGVILMVLIGFFLFDAQVMFSYAGHLVAPAFVLLIEDADRFEHKNPADAYLERWTQRLLPFLTIERSLVLMRVFTGLTFMYLAVVDKYLHSPQLERIIETNSFPTFGIPPEYLVFIMAAVELAGGFALVVGIAERLVAVFLICAMVMFAVVLGESPLLHANIFGILIAIFLLGPGYWNDKPLEMGARRLGFAGLRVLSIVALAAVIVFSSSWVNDLRARVPSSDARLVWYTGPEDRRPVLQEVQVEKVGDSFYRLRIVAQNFVLTSYPNPYWEESFQGHAHVYSGKYQLATLYSDEAIVGPISEDITQLTVALMNPLHCYIKTSDGILMQTVNLDTNVATTE